MPSVSQVSGELSLQNENGSQDAISHKNPNSEQNEVMTAATMATSVLDTSNSLLENGNHSGIEAEEEGAVGLAEASSLSILGDLNLSSDTLDRVEEYSIENSPENSPHLFHHHHRNPSPNILPGTSKTQSSESLPILPNQKAYDYLLKVLLVGDSDVGKQEILSGLEDGTLDSPFCSSSAGAAYKTTTILIDGKRVKLQLWDTSGQGRFCTIIRSYSRGAQGILLVYDITNKWSFEGIDRWLKEVDHVNILLNSLIIYAKTADIF